MVLEFRRKGVAIVIEAGELVHTICDFLQSFGYETISVPDPCPRGGAGTRT